MAFLTFNGTPISAAPDSVERQEDDIVGSESRSYAGNQRTTVRTAKRSWKVGTKTLPQASVTTIEGIVANRAAVTVNGDMVNNVAVSCTVRITQYAFLRAGGVVRQRLSLLITEI